MGCYPAVDEMIEIFDENWSDEFCVVDVQNGWNTVECAEDVAEFFDHFPVAIGNILILNEYEGVIGQVNRLSHFTFFHIPQAFPKKGIGLGPEIPWSEKTWKVDVPRLQSKFN